MDLNPMNASENKRPGAVSLLLQAAAWILLVAVDLLTKSAAVTALKGQPPIVIIEGVLELLYVQNTGAAFSILENTQWLFILIAVAAIAVITWLLLRIPVTRHYLPMRILLLLISAGAAGNLADRLVLGYVRDFIYIVLIDFPVFNAADMYVTVSVVLLALYILFFYTDEDLTVMNPRRASGRTADRHD